MILSLTFTFQTKEETDNSGPGVIYIGHIPHGFFEPQMKGYYLEVTSMYIPWMRVSFRNFQCSMHTFLARVWEWRGIGMDCPELVYFM